MTDPDPPGGGRTGRTEGTTITVYTREKCHLCADAIDTVRRVSDESGRDVAIRLVDVDDDPE